MRKNIIRFCLLSSLGILILANSSVISIAVVENPIEPEAMRREVDALSRLEEKDRDYLVSTLAWIDAIKAYEARVTKVGEWRFDADMPSYEETRKAWTQAGMSDDRIQSVTLKVDRDFQAREDLRDAIAQSSLANKDVWFGYTAKIKRVNGGEWPELDAIIADPKFEGKVRVAAWADNPGEFFTIGQVFESAGIDLPYVLNNKISKEHLKQGLAIWESKKRGSAEGIYLK